MAYDWDMKNATWTVTSPDGKTVTYEQDYNVEGGKVAQAGSTMSLPLDVFLTGVEKMKAAGFAVVEGSRK